MSTETFLNDLSRRWGQVQSLRATLETHEMTAFGVTALRDKIVFRAPDSCRIEPLRPATAADLERVMVCSQGRTMLLLPALSTVRVWPRNLLMDWPRLTGGPANVAGFHLLAGQLSRDYQLRPILVEDKLSKGQVLEVSTRERPKMVLDYPKTGHSFYRLFYAPFKQPFYDSTPGVDLVYDVGRLALLRQDHYSSRPKGLRFLLTATAHQEVLPGLWFPTAFRMTDALGATIAEYSYKDIQVNAASSAAGPATEAEITLSVPDGFIREDAELRTVDAYMAQSKEKSNDPHWHYNLGRAYWTQQEDNEAALREMLRTAEVLPRSPAPHVRAAELLTAAGHLWQALEEYQKALDLQSSYPGVNEAMVLLFLAQGNLDSALHHADLAVAHSPQNTPALLNRAELLQRLGRFDEAREVYAKVLEANPPDQPAAVQRAAEDLLVLARWTGSLEGLLQASREDNAWSLMLAGKAALLLGKPEQALADFEAARKAAPANDSLSLSIVRSLLEAHRPGDAKKVLAELSKARRPANVVMAMSRASVLVALDGNDLSAAMDSSGNLLAMLSSHRERLSARSALAAAFEKRLATEQLLRLLDERTKRTPCEPWAAKLYADLLIGRGQTQAAVPILQRALQSARGDALLHSTLAECLFAKKDKESRHAAANEVRAAIDIESSQPYYRAQLAYMQEMGGAPRAALDAANDLVSRFPNDDDALIVLGTILGDPGRGEPDASLSAFNKALALQHAGAGNRHEQLAFLRQAMANVAMQAKRPAQAREQFARLMASAASPVEGGAFTATAARSFLRLKEYDEALHLARKALAETCDPTEKIAFTDGLSSALLLEPGAFDEMAARVQAQVEKEPDSAELNYLLGKLFLVGNSPAAARRWLDKAASQRPRDAFFLSECGDAHLLTGDSAGAADLYQRTLALQPSDRPTYISLALALAKSGQKDKAEKLGADMMLRVANDAQAFEALAKLLGAAGDPKEAVQYGQQALALSLANWDSAAEEAHRIRLTIADSMKEAKDYAAAKEILVRLSQPTLPPQIRLDAMLALADTHIAAGELVETRETLDRVRKLFDTPAVRQQVDARMKDLEKKAGE